MRKDRNHWKELQLTVAESVLGGSTSIFLSVTSIDFTVSSARGDDETREGTSEETEA